jgi:nucleoid DNA-binding protein
MENSELAMKEKFIRADIAKTIADAGIERVKAAGLALAIVQAMADALTAGKAIELRGLGTLEPRERKARTAHDPRTLAPKSQIHCKQYVSKLSIYVSNPIQDKELQKSHWVRGSNPRGGAWAVRKDGFFIALLCFILLHNSLQDKELAL